MHKEIWTKCSHIFIRYIVFVRNKEKKTEVRKKDIEQSEGKRNRGERAFEKEIHRMRLSKAEK